MIKQPSLVLEDFKLIDSLFPYLNISWNVLTWKIATLPYPILGQYFSSRKLIILDTNHVHDESVRFHELGHFIHDVMFNYRPILFPSYQDLTYKEQFAVAFEDTMIRVRYKRQMKNDNLKIYQLIKEVNY
jgi:Zn-dependent peptidase ImmA (M78 family)